MAEFDLSALMKDVSEQGARVPAGGDPSHGMGTTREQIEYIPIDLIDPDPDNFYSLDGIDELAGSIEMVGLQQPLRLRPAQGGRYTVVSGHRRRAAVLLIIDGGSEQFSGGVPCIIERDEASPAMRELRLILANSDTRKMTSADQNRQAERVEALIVQLEDEGFEFPGRLRDWVAKISGMSRSKLARLKVIRDKLEPSIRKAYYDVGELSEDSAYELARLPEEHQRRVVDWYITRDRKDPRFWYADTIKAYGKDLARFDTYACPEKLGGRECLNREAMMDKVWANGHSGWCHCGYDLKCCATCPDIASCRSVCVRMQEKAAEAKAQCREAKRAEKAAAEKEEAPKRDQVRNLWLRFGSALSRANLEDEELRVRLHADGFYSDVTQIPKDEIVRLECGEGSKVRGDMVLPFNSHFYLSDARQLVAMADALCCSLDYLFCRTDEPEPAGNVSEQGARVPAGGDPSHGMDTPPAAEWGTGKPPRPGLYAVRFKVSETAPGEIHNFARWTGWNWEAARSGKVIADMIAAAWYEIPEVKK